MAGLQDGRKYPALEIHGQSSDLLLIALDDYSPTAIDERETSLRAFFSTSADRDRAHQALAAAFTVTAVDVPDEDWARRSQADLQPITVGRLTILPNPESLIPHPYTIAIPPSMGFGTGHHATTRLCLEAMQTLDLEGRSVLDIGTGSGVLAIAADRLGAASAIGVDNDPDATQAAQENVALNGSSARVDVADLAATALAPADVVTANLTGALLIRSNAVLAAAVKPGGALIVSGLLADERDAVVRAYGIFAIAWEREESGWVGLLMKKS